MVDAPATTESKSQTASDIKVEDNGPACKRITITISADTIKQKLDDQVGTLSANTALPGFRKGKAPRQLLERRFGETVREETKTQIMAEAYAQAIEEKDIKPVGEPEPTSDVKDLKLIPGESLTFTIDVEVTPEFDLPPLDGIEIKKPIFEITKERIQAELDRQCRQLGIAKKIDGDFQEGDILAVQVTVNKEGETEPLVTDQYAVISVPSKDAGGRGPVLGLMIDGLAGILKAAKAGDSIALKAVGPEAYEREDVRGASLNLEVRITGAERPEPATVEQVVEAFGLGNEENLQEQMRLGIGQQNDNEQASAMREQLYDYLAKAVDFELPKKLSAAQASRNLERQRIELLERGLMPAEVEERLAEIREESEANTQLRLKLFFVMHRLADHFDIEVSEQEVNGRIASIAAQRGVRPDQIRSELSQAGRLADVSRVIREHKAADKAIAGAKIVEIPAEEWASEKSGQSKKKTKKKTSSTTGKKKTNAKNEASEGSGKKKTTTKNKK
ncbi:MAG: trigger factor [Planctomycetes bacterium]|nr:trigger factor [Planctomycetota bacterium]